MNIPVGTKIRAYISYYIAIVYANKKRFARNDDKYIPMKKELGRAFSAHIYTLDEERKYSNQLNCLKKKYKGVKFCYIDMLNIGPMIFYYMDLVQQVEQNSDLKYVVLLNSYQGYIYDKNSSAIANHYLLTCMERYGEIIDSNTLPFWSYVLNHADNGFITYHVLSDFCQDKNFHKENMEKDEQEGRCFLNFNEDESSAGDVALSFMGVHDPYYCFFSRNNEYHKKYFARDSHDKMLDITGKRNSEIIAFQEGCLKAKKYGWQAVRVGAVDQRKISGANIIDYTNSGRTEFLDFYVMSKAQFFIGDASGIMYIPKMLNVPCAIINNLSVFWQDSKEGSYNNQKDYTIFKRFFCKETKQYWTLADILDFQKKFGLSDELEIRLLNGIGIEFEDNTAEEIADLTEEMILRLTGRWKDTEEDIFLRQRYWNMVNVAYKDASRLFRLYDLEPGAVFLRKNKWWLGL